MKLSTKIIQSIPVDKLTGSIAVPIYQTSTFVQESPGEHLGFDYSRSNNPTRKVLEDMIAELEEGSSGFAFASGLAAVDAVIKLLESGDEILAVDDIYGGSFRTFTHIFEKFGIKVNYVDTSNISEVEKNIHSEVKLVWLETPTNPTLKISDIEAIAEIAHKNNSLLLVDNTFASPVIQQPIKLGADIVIHSATKYLGGHCDLIAGLVVTKTAELGEKIKFIQNSTGSILSPFDSWLVIRGIQTLLLRVKKHCHNALKVAQHLNDHEDVEAVYYPGLPSHPNHHIAKRQQKIGYGGVVSFSFKNDVSESARVFVTNTKIFKLAESLGGVKSLLCHPATMTHKSTPVETRKAAGIKDSLVRLSVGLEDPTDLIEDINQALSKVKEELTILNS